MHDAFRALRILVVSIVVITAFLHHVNAGVMCYNCDGLSHPRDCDRVLECDTHEICYGEEIVTDDALVKFRSGCKFITLCTSGSQFNLVGKRNDLLICSKCCNTSYCNLETCDRPVTTKQKRCLSCDYALSPTDCNHSILCKDEEICYSQTIIHNQEKRYRLGCVHKNQCGETFTPGSSSYFIPVTPSIFGRRTTEEYCGQCCDGNNCNRELFQVNNVAKSALISPPPLLFCRDNSTSSCATKVSLCNDEYYKYYQCPATCRQCGTAPVVTVAPVDQKTPVATTTSVTTPLPTLAPKECRDNPTYKCSSLVCLVPDLAKECRATCNTCYAIITTPNSESCQTADAIPECQCRYLDNELDLCHESTIFHQLRRFCCYYCKRKNNGHCGNCARIEEHEKQQVANMNIGCIDPALQG